MMLTDAQREKVAAWISEGLKLSEIQERLASEFGLRLTYLEVRLLVDDLKLVPKDNESSANAANAAARAANATAPQSVGRVTVTVAEIARPGALVSGQVTFSDGQQAEWYLDQAGRLGVIPKQAGYKPSPNDIQEFQIALDREMARLGF
ncbi:MAG: hypothetical protein RMK20_08365 [Verrucomicrobiales bacterium]|nr:hypothetical protein [Verrucomicrobiales bacterium]